MQSTVSDICYASDSYRAFIIIFCVYYDYTHIYIFIFCLLLDNISPRNNIIFVMCVLFIYSSYILVITNENIILTSPINYTLLLLSYKFNRNGIISLGMYYDNLL